MAKQTGSGETKKNIIERIRDYFNEVMAELSKVAWPSQQELKSSTSIVMLLLIALAIIIGVYDKVFQVVILMLLTYA